MFEFMDKYKLPILIVIFVAMMGFGVWGGLATLFGGPPNEVIGTFAMPGVDERVEVWSEDYQAVADRFRGGGEDYWKGVASRLGISETEFSLFIWDMIVLYEAAKASGIHPTAADVERAVRNSAQVPEDEDLNLHEDFVSFQRMMMAVGQFRSQYMMDPGGPTFHELLLDYRREYSTVKAKVILFEKKELESFALDLGKEEDKTKLKEWFERNRWVAAANKKNESVDLEIAYVRLKGQKIADLEKLFNEKWAELTKDMTVSEEDLQARYKTSTFAYQQLSHAEMAAEGIEHTHGEDGPDEDYEYLKKKGHLEREIKVARLMKKLYDEVKDAPEKLEETAKKYNIDVKKLPEAERTALAEQPDFGSLRLSAMVWETGIAKLPKDGAEPQDGDYKLGSVLVDPYQPAGGLQSDVFDDPGGMIGLIRMTAHKEEREPEFEEILVEAKKEWQKAQARDDLSKQTKDFQDAVDDWILALPELKEKVDAAKKNRDEKVEEEIKNKKLDRENPEHKDQIEQAKNRQHHFMKTGLAEEMKPHFAKGYDAIAAERKLTPFMIGPIHKVSGLLPQYPEGIARQERVNRFLRSKSLLNSLSFLDVGRMTTMPVDAAGLGAAALLTEKIEPNAAELLDYPMRVAEIANRKRVQPDRGQGYKIFKDKRFFDLSAPKTDEWIAEKDESERERLRRRAERARLRNEKRQAALRKKLEEQNPNLKSPQDTDTDTPNPPDKVQKPAGTGDKKPGGTGDKKPGGGN